MAIHALKKGYMLREYRLEKLLGEGGFGLTYLGFDTNLEKKVAIKEYMPSEHAVRETDSKIIAKSKSSKKVYDWGLNAFLNEAKTLAKFEDPNIVRVFRFFKANGTAYIVMEYCEGGCLIDKVSKTKHMPEHELKHIMSSIARGLQLVHNDGFLHRDIKPDNIMFRQDGTPVLIDFGAARQAIGNKSKKVTTIITPGYAPLEQYSSNGVIGPWSDIYSLSAVAYICLTGSKPPDIMMRLHDDKIEKLSLKTNSTPFLKSIDLGLEMNVDDRPQSLSEWSHNWCEYKLPDTVEFENNDNTEFSQENIKPIHTIHSPISARSTLDPFEATRVNANSIELNKSSSSGFLKVLLTLILASGLGAGGFFGYQYYLKQQEVENQTKKQDELAQKQLIIESNKQKGMILLVQKSLNQMGFKVPENGKIDARTIQSIKAFEKNNGLIITGSVDEILLEEIKKQSLIVEEKDWNIAQQNNNKLGFEEFLSKYPDSVHQQEANNLISSFNLVNSSASMDSKSNKEKNKPIKNSRLSQISAIKRQMVKDIQVELKRLKYHSISTDGDLGKYTKNSIMSYQRAKGIEVNGLPSKTLIFQLKSESIWPGKAVGKTFKNCKNCPTMVTVPSGGFMMGGNSGKGSESPRHNVNIRQFAMSQTEITFAQWDACFDEGACTHHPNDDQLGRLNKAVMHVNWYDVNQFIKWISEESGKKYRLPTEAQWEYAARAKSVTKYSWGNSMGSNHANCVGCNSEIDRNQYNQVKLFKPNAFGLYDMHGNVWEWTADCWHPNYSGAPSDGQAWEPNGCNKYVVRGGSSGNNPDDLRSASRGAMDPTKRLNSLGFRVVLD